MYFNSRVNSYFLFDISVETEAAASISCPGSCLHTLWNSTEGELRSVGVRHKEGPLTCLGISFQGGDQQYVASHLNYY